jgi:hypothetical protein
MIGLNQTMALSPLSSVSTITLNHLLQNSSKVTKVAARKSQKSGPQLMSERHRRRLLIRGNDDSSEISQDTAKRGYFWKFLPAAGNDDHNRFRINVPMELFWKSIKGFINLDPFSGIKPSMRCRMSSRSELGA